MNFCGTFLQSGNKAEVKVFRPATFVQSLRLLPTTAHAFILHILCRSRAKVKPNGLRLDVVIDGIIGIRTQGIWKCTTQKPQVPLKI